MKTFIFLFYFSLIMPLSNALALEHDEVHYIDRSEVVIGSHVARELERQQPISSNMELKKRIARIGLKLAKFSDRPDLSFTFNVLNKKKYNAYALPGGFVYINTGLIERTPSDDVLAFSIGHEIAHIARKHWRQHAKERTIMKVLGAIVDGTLGGTLGAVTKLLTEVQSQKYSREQELEADHYAIYYMQGAGFDLRGALAALRIARAMEASDPNSPYLSSHPETSKRLEVAREKVRRLNNISFQDSLH